MKDGIRKVIFTEMIKNIPAGTNKMVSFSKISEVVEKFYAEAFPEDCKAEVVRVFGKHKLNHKTMQFEDMTFEQLVEEGIAYMKTEEKIIQWAADNLGWKEFLECTQWLIDNGYVREFKKPARFGERWYLGITSKGWSVAHLYR